jgi:hypothetical protein
MNPAIRSALISTLRGIARVFFVLGFLAFAFGDWIIRAYTGAGAALGVFESILLALLLAGIGGIVMVAVDHLEEAQDNAAASLGEALRK